MLNLSVKKIGWLVLGALLINACKQTATPTNSSHAPQQRVTDELNRTVSLPVAPQRIVSLAPNLTEILFALGLNDRIAAVTSFCDFPAEAKAKPQIGTTLQPDLERLIALKPDLVLVSTASQLQKLTAQLDQLQIPVYVTDPRSVRAVPVSIRHLGEVTGTRERAEQLASALEQRIDQIAQAVRDLPHPRVLFLLQNTPLITVGRASFIDDLLQLAGAESISRTETTAYPQFSRETVVARAPEIIIAPVSHGQDLLDETELRRSFAATPAIQQNRIIRINPDLTSRPGPRLIDGLVELARQIHPKAFSASGSTGK